MNVHGDYMKFKNVLFATDYDYAENKLIFNDALGEECLPVLREIRDTFPNAGIEMYPFEAAQMFSINLTPFSEQHFTSQGIEFVQISDPAEALFDFAEKIVQ